MRVRIFVSRETNMGKMSAKADKPMRDALLAALQSEVSVKRGGKSVKARRLTVIADMLVTLAADGNLAAIREICDRIDGKATQPVAGDRDNPLLDVTAIKHALAKKLARLAES
jgi:ribosomal protein L17